MIDRMEEIGRNERLDPVNGYALEDELAVSYIPNFSFNILFSLHGLTYQLIYFAQRPEVNLGL